MCDQMYMLLGSIEYQRPQALRNVYTCALFLLAHEPMKHVNQLILHLSTERYRMPSTRVASQSDDAFEFVVHTCLLTHHSCTRTQHGLQSLQVYSSG